MRKILVLCFVVYFTVTSAQHIRKNYKELTGMEIANYNHALQLLWNGGSTSINYHAWFAGMHSTHFGTSMHSVGGGENFTSFHRFFLLHWELVLKNTNPSYQYLNLPYWDWTNDPPKPSFSPGPNITSTSDPTFWAYSFLPISNFASWGVTRINTSPPNQFFDASTLPYPSDYAAALAEIPFHHFTFPSGPPPASNFRATLEGPNHAPVHGWVGGTMSGGNSPLDPIFFSHHAMVDKIWQEWEDQTGGLQSVFTSTAYPLPVYNTIHGWFCDLNPDDTKDSRNLPFTYVPTFPLPPPMHDVWYAQDEKVILDGANGSDFIVNGNGKIYRYCTPSAWPLGGSMYIGDVYRDPSNNILPDNKGGFMIPAGVSAHFRAGGDITLLPGASAYANGSSEVTFGIIVNANGF